ncbi:50S ribosomal protein L22 [bacterium]|nr:50S ribosomal protein L22 [bacterium]
MKNTDFLGYCESKYLRVSPYKVRKVADIVRKLNVIDALKLLKIQPQNAATYIYKALYSAYHNAKNKGVTSDDLLYIDTIIVDEAKQLKRFKARARGRAFSIVKRTCHIKIGLKEKESKNVKVGEANGTKD